VATIVLTIAAGLVDFWADPDQRLWSLIFSAFVFGFTLLLCPACRPQKRYSICPINWAILVFFLQLVALPFCVVIFGVAEGALRSLPSQSALNAAILINDGAFLAFCVGYQITLKRRQRATRYLKAPSAVVIGCFLCAGIIGFVATFKSFPNIAEYYIYPASRPMPVAGETTVAGALGTLLRPFLGFACIAYLCRRVHSPFRSKSQALIITVACLTVATIAQLSFSYNRVVFVVPVTCGLAVFSKHIHRIRPMALALLATAAAVPLLLIGTYRGTQLRVTDLVEDPYAIRGLLDKTEIGQFFQVYGNGPQFTAFVVQNLWWPNDLLYGRSLVASLLYPVPVLGKPFRDQSGVGIYNRLIYGNSETIDQVIPFEAEVLINFGVAGVLISFCLLGILIHRLQSQFDSSQSAVDTLVTQYFGIWLLSLTYSSLAVLSQVMIYSSLPLYALMLTTGSISRRTLTHLNPNAIKRFNNASGAATNSATSAI
jgi:hypothetical protein